MRAFLSFDLLNARPDLGQALALGEEVLVVIDGEAYRITGQEGEPEVVPVPANLEDIEIADQPPEEVPEVPPTEASASAFGVNICASALILPLLVAAGWGTSRRRKKA